MRVLGIIGFLLLAVGAGCIFLFILEVALWICVAVFVCWVIALIVIVKRLNRSFHGGISWHDPFASTFAMVVLSLPTWLLLARFGPSTLSDSLRVHLLGLPQSAKQWIVAAYGMSL